MKLYALIILLFLLCFTASYKYRSHQLQKGLKFLLRATENDVIPVMSISDITSYANICDITLKATSTGPFLKLEAFTPGYAGFNDVKVGYLTAFVRPLPLNLLHLETIQVQNRRQVLGFKRKGWTMDGPGISFIMGSYALVWAHERGCRKAQLLAVNDSNKMNRILTRLYESFGFTKIRDVGDDLSSVSDRIMWGGIGTLMELDLPSFFREFTPQLPVLIAQAVEKKIARRNEGF